VDVYRRRISLDAAGCLVAVEKLEATNSLTGKRSYRTEGDTAHGGRTERWVSDMTSDPPKQASREQDMTIIITDEDVKRLLPMRDCIEGMWVAFGDLADGAAVNRPLLKSDVPCAPTSSSGRRAWPPVQGSTTPSEA
jgi:hypothetical protein